MSPTFSPLTFAVLHSALPQLSRRHNDGVFLPPDSEWTDFMDIRFMRDDTPALLEYHTDEFNEKRPDNLPYHLDQYFTGEEYSDWQRLSFSLEKRDHQKEALEHITNLEEFTRRQIKDPSFSKGFIWEVHQEFNWFDNTPALTEYFAERQTWGQPATGTHGQYPFVCKYSHHIPSLASEVSGKCCAISAVFFVQLMMHICMTANVDFDFS